MQNVNIPGDPVIKDPIIRGIEFPEPIEEDKDLEETDEEV